MPWHLFSSSSSSSSSFCLRYLFVVVIICVCVFGRRDATTPWRLTSCPCQRARAKMMMKNKKPSAVACRDPSSEARRPGAYTSWCAYVAIVQPTVAVGMGPTPRHRQHLFSYIYIIIIIIICVWKCTAISARSNTSLFTDATNQPTNQVFFYGNEALTAIVHRFQYPTRCILLDMFSLKRNESKEETLACLFQYFFFLFFSGCCIIPNA
jgi:hypothetical protein